MKPVIAISMGDFNGIGPEVILKAFNQLDLERSVPVVVGSVDVLKYYLPLTENSPHIRRIESFDRVAANAGSNCDTDEDNTLQIYNSTDSEIEPEPGRISESAGSAAMKAVEECISFCSGNHAAAMVTAPISKESIQLAGYKFPGHTEFLAHKTDTFDFQMILVSKSLRVALATIHEPIRRIAPLITPGLISQQLILLSESLKNDFDIAEPAIAVLSLNPHAGDGGVIGDEEITVIRPVVDEAAEKGIRTDGPFAADSFFGNQTYLNYDGILAMYHDQGLIPFKTLSFGSGVNFTAGLPVIRTSPDHGTGFDIAGKNKASESSFVAAYELAVDMVYNKMTKGG